VPGSARSEEKGAGMGGSGEAQGQIGLGRGGESVKWMEGDGGADPRRGQDAGGYTGWIGWGICWGMLSSGPAARSGTAGCSDSEPSRVRALRLTRVRTRVWERRERLEPTAAAAAYAL
jgi:hypothetical protein